jgi:hypothetical protein
VRERNALQIVFEVVVFLCSRQFLACGLWYAYMNRSDDGITSRVVTTSGDLFNPEIMIHCRNKSAHELGRVIALNSSGTPLTKTSPERRAMDSNAWLTRESPSLILRGGQRDALA